MPAARRVYVKGAWVLRNAYRQLDGCTRRVRGCCVMHDGNKVGVCKKCVGAAQCIPVARQVYVKGA